MDIVILEWEHPSETGTSCSCHARQWHTTPSPVSQGTSIQTTLLWFCTWIFPHSSRYRNDAKAATDLPKRLVLCHPFLFLPHLQLQRTLPVLSKWLDSFLDKAQVEVKDEKTAYTGKKWGHGCLWDINLLFEISHWQKSSKGFTLHQELNFWKNYDGLMGKEWIYNAACLKTLQILSGDPKQLALQVSGGSQASSGECPAPAAKQGCWVIRARWIRGGCTPILIIHVQFFKTPNKPWSWDKCHSPILLDEILEATINQVLCKRTLPWANAAVSIKE